MALELLGDEVRSVVDVGCGSGDWLAVFAEHGIEDYIGVDAAHVPRELLKIPADRFEARDLRRPLRLERRFDLALSLEVGEHLPAECAEHFVAGLAALAPVVLFSAAIPFQVGTGHVNCQWPDYWAQLFATHGMVPIDPIRDRVWATTEVEWWYAQNILMFASELALASRPQLRAMVVSEPSKLPKVHPRGYLTLVDPEQMSLRWTLERLRRVVPRALRRRA